MSSSFGQHGRNRQDTRQGPGIDMTKDSDKNLLTTTRLQKLPRIVSPESAQTGLEQAHAVHEQIKNSPDQLKYSEDTQNRVVAPHSERLLKVRNKW